MAGQNKHILSIKFTILLFIFLHVSTAWAQAPQTFNTDGDTGFYYTIQKGDTLWDLSQKFYNSQWDWPGLWEMNKDIKNPHWIYPGNKIRIYLKSELQQQALKQSQTSTKAVPATVTPKFNYPPIDHISFIKKTEETALGTIIRERDANLMMSVNDIIYIKPETDTPLVPGERYLVFTTEPLKQKINGATFRGVKHLIKAEIDVIETNARYVTAVIDESYRYATVGDKIMAYTQRDTMITIQNNPAPMDGTILCSPDNEQMINDYQVAFINKGAKDNVHPGQIYSVFQVQENRSVHDGEGAKLLDPQYSGRLIVLHTEDISSTVMILSSKRDIHPGDLVK